MSSRQATVKALVVGGAVAAVLGQKLKHQKLKICGSSMFIDILRAIELPKMVRFAFGHLSN